MIFKLNCQEHHNTTVSVTQDPKNIENVSNKLCDGFKDLKAGPKTQILWGIWVSECYTSGHLNTTNKSSLVH